MDFANFEDLCVITLGQLRKSLMIVSCQAKYLRRLQEREKRLRIAIRRIGETTGLFHVDSGYAWWLSRAQ